LLAGADRDLAPVFLPLLLALVIEPHFAMFGEQGRDDVYTQLGGFLDRIVHALAARNADAEHGMQRRLDRGA
jgi:hypothetical protein